MASNTCPPTHAWKLLWLDQIKFGPGRLIQAVKQKDISGACPAGLKEKKKNFSNMGFSTCTAKKVDLSFAWEEKSGEQLKMVKRFPFKISFVTICPSK